MSDQSVSSGGKDLSRLGQLRGRRTCREGRWFQGGTVRTRYRFPSTIVRGINFRCFDRRVSLGRHSTSGVVGPDYGVNRSQSYRTETPVFYPSCDENTGTSGEVGSDRVSCPIRGSQDRGLQTNQTALGRGDWTRQKKGSFLVDATREGATLEV